LVAAISMNDATNAYRAVGGKPVFVNVDKLPASIQIRIYR